MPIILIIAGVAAAVTAWILLEKRAPAAAGGDHVRLDLERYAPWTDEAASLFRLAAERAGLPVSWASEDGLHQILSKESGGWVGIPNYTYAERLAGLTAANPKERSRLVHEYRSRWPEIWAELREGRMTGRQFEHAGKLVRSSATGLGQLTLPNVRLYYPSGVRGIGVPIEEATGMLKYIEARYGNPKMAWLRYGKAGEGY